ncbi:MAG: ParB/RepB/Spo0J family partition protein [Maricaulaceae bacterium]|nr:ParB/RepB/Spo0J family partition protein [Maricaulaceae bacterium]
MSAADGDAPERTRGLGRGLSALLGEDGPAEAGKPASAGARAVAIADIRPNPKQPRKRFTEDEIAALAESIAAQGVLQPILLRPAPDGEGYEIVAGERRWRAAQKARLHEIPALVRELTDRETLEVALVENLQRADLNPIEEAEAYRQLQGRFGHSQEEIARAVGKSRPHVANTLRLLSLPDDIRTYLAEGELSAGHARAIASVPNAAALAARIVREGLSVRAAEALAAETRQAPERKGGAKPQKDADTRALEADLSARLGLEVSIKGQGESGALTIRYRKLEQLDDLCRRLTGG